MRNLKEKEKEIIKEMLTNSEWRTFLRAELDNIKVKDMNDGEMGSIKFNSQSKILENKRIMKKCISQREFIDDDGLLVQISLNIDNNNDLYEMDFWKVDFSPIIKYPDPNKFS